jgi:hypothetical protein
VEPAVMVTRVREVPAGQDPIPVERAEAEQRQCGGEHDCVATDHDGSFHWARATEQPRLA